MDESMTGELDAVIERMQKRFNEIEPENRVEKFLAELHGPGWKERALAAGRPEHSFSYGRRLRDLERRLERIEEHLGLPRSTSDHGE
jgi:hypothetical protein